jgi:hypothetical protein
MITLIKTCVCTSKLFTVRSRSLSMMELTCIEKREAPLADQYDGRGVPWRKLTEFGYTIENFPAYLDPTRPLDQTRPETWNKSEKLALWNIKERFRFIKTASMPPVTHSTDENSNVTLQRRPFRGITLPVLAPGPNVPASQPETLEEALKKIYLANPDRNTAFKNKAFYRHLQSTEPDLAAKVTADQVKSYVTEWRRGIRKEIEQAVSVVVDMEE